MMQHFDYILQAARAAKRWLNDKRAHAVGAVAIRRDGAVVQSRNGSAQEPIPEAHAEFRVLRKAGRGAIVYVARVRKDGSLGLARPCERCQTLIKQLDAEVYYVTDDGEVERL